MNARGTTEPLPPAAEVAPLDPVAAGSTTILLVEDESGIRTLAKRVLESSGYGVLEASGGEDALRLVQGYAGPIHLVLTDVVMHEMGGLDLAVRLLEERPDLRLIFMSGYPGEITGVQRDFNAAQHYLAKPFRSHDLLQAVHDAMNQGGASGA